MAFIRKTWVDRQSATPAQRKLTNVNDLSDVKYVTVERDEGTVTVQGDVFDAATMNNLEERINAGFSGVPEFTDLTATLTAGSTTVTFSDSSILTTSTIDYYIDDAHWDLVPNSITVATGSVTLTFSAQSSNVSLKVRVWI